MRSKTLFLIFLLSFEFVTLYALNMNTVVGLSELLVPSQYPTIQAAIDAAGKDDTILVAAGIYYENLEVNQTVNIIGEDKSTTIIDGQGSGIVIDVLRKDVYISGFTIHNGGNNYGVYIAYYEEDHTPVRPSAQIVGNIIANNSNGVFMDDSDGNTVVGNTFLNNTMAAVGLSSSSNNDISGNTIIESTYGIRISGGTSNDIIGNRILNRTTSYGIFSASSTGNVISGNNISSQHRGIYNDKSNNNIIDHNIISDSAEAITIAGSEGCTITYNIAFMNAYGIRVMSVIGAQGSIWVSTNNLIENNSIIKNDWGIELFSVPTNTFIGNWISTNKYGVFIAYPQGGNVFYHNNLINSIVQQVYQQHLEEWDDGVGEGNYWSDYTGVDDGSGGRVAGDGVGDTKLPHQGVDYYPLMSPWPSRPDVAVESVSPSATSVYVGQLLNITVMVVNEGTTAQIFDVKVYGSATLIETQRDVTLPAGASTTLKFTWDTTGVAEGLYIIKAEIPPVPEETDIDDNTLIYGEVTVLPPVIHDVAITGITLLPTQIRPGETVTVDVTVQNQGTFPETFNVTIYYNITSTEWTLIGTQRATELAAATSVTLSFSWNTTNLSPSVYTLLAVASTVTGEIDITDNTLIDGILKVFPLGDVDGDRDVDIDDLAYVLIGYGMTIEDAMATYGVPPGTDIDGDGTIDLDDLYYVLQDYGYPYS